MTRHKLKKLQPTILSLFSNTIDQGTKSSHELTMEASGITCKQLITMPKMYTFWFMNQAHKLKWGNLENYGLEGTKKISSRVSDRLRMY